MDHLNKCRRVQIMSQVRRNPFRLAKVVKFNQSPDYLEHTKKYSITNGQRTFSIEERKELINNIDNELKTQEFNNIVDIIRISEPDKLQEDATGREFDLRELNDTTLFKLKRHIETCRGQNSSAAISRTSKNQISSRVDSSTGAKRSLSKKVGFDASMYSEYQCAAIKKLRNKICFICGLTSKSFNVTDHLKRQYKDIFDLELKVENFTPNTICGTCRSSLTCKKRVRKFQFSKPVIWRPTSKHSIDDTDCYFCIVVKNKNFFAKKDRVNLPQTSNCSLPKIGQCTTSKIKQKSVSNSSTLSETSTDPGREGETLKYLKREFAILHDKLNTRLDRMESGVNEIRNEQQTITSSIDIFASFLTMISNRNNHALVDQNMKE